MKDKNKILGFTRKKSISHDYVKMLNIKMSKQTNKQKHQKVKIKQGIGDKIDITCRPKALS